MGKKILLTSVFGPYGVKDGYTDPRGTQMELFNSQITREQGVHSPRQVHLSFNLYLLAENISVNSTVLDFPSWKDFIKELRNGGYTEVGITFVTNNILKVKRMTEHIRKHHPEIKIILGGYGTMIPDLDKIVPFDEKCVGEGVKWLRNYYGDDITQPIVHPSLGSHGYQYLYGFKTKARGAVILSGLGCVNGCIFCATTKNFCNEYIPLLHSGKEIFDACVKAEKEMGSRGFVLMDENFLSHASFAKDLLIEMEKHKKLYGFDIFASADRIIQMGVDFFVRLGIRTIWIGVETKADIFEKTKGIDIPALIDRLQSAGISVIVSGMLFFDHHDEKSIYEDIDYLVNLGSDMNQTMIYTAFPNTGLYHKLKEENRLLENMPYHLITASCDPGYLHPHFKDRKIFAKIQKEAFQRKFEVGGPAVLNKAYTAIRGYIKAVKDYKEREDKQLVWNSENFCYEPCQGEYSPDEFMKARIKRLKRMTLGMRVIVPVAKFFAPNQKTKEKADRVEKLYSDCFGNPTFKQRLISFLLILTGIKESIIIQLYKLWGGREFIRQPKLKRVEYIKNS